MKSTPSIPAAQLVSRQIKAIGLSVNQGEVPLKPSCNSLIFSTISPLPNSACIPYACLVSTMQEVSEHIPCSVLPMWGFFLATLADAGCGPQAKPASCFPRLSGTSQSSMRSTAAKKHMLSQQGCHSTYCLSASGRCCSGATSVLVPRRLSVAAPAGRGAMCTEEELTCVSREGVEWKDIVGG